jgi:hypothetical protein
MRANFRLSDSLLTQLNAIIKKHWPQSTPLGHSCQAIFNPKHQTLVNWALHHPITIGSLQETLSLRLSQPFIKLGVNGEIDIEYGEVLLEYAQALRTFISVRSISKSVTFPISMDDVLNAEAFNEQILHIKQNVQSTTVTA